MQLIDQVKLSLERWENPEGPVDIQRLAGVDGADVHCDYELALPPGHLDTYVCAGFGSRVKCGCREEVSIN